MKHAILAILALALASCETATTYHPDGGKTVVKTMDGRVYMLATKGLEVIAYRYPTDQQK